MIDVAVLCPHPPVLLGGVTGGPVPEVLALRAACQQAIESLRSSEVVIVVGSAPRTGRYDPALPSPATRFAPIAGQAGPESVLPLSLGVAVDLGVGPAAQLWGVGADEPVARCAALGRELVEGTERVGLLVMGDGSTRRGEKAPGYLDSRAVPFDDAVEAALQGADGQFLLDLDRDLAAALQVGGIVAWQVLAGAFGGRPASGRVLYSDAPFGVWYPVAVWTPGPVAG